MRLEHIASEEIRQHKRAKPAQCRRCAQRPHIFAKEFEHGGGQVHKERFVAAIQFKKDGILPMQDCFGEICDKNFVMLDAGRKLVQPKKAKPQRNRHYAKGEPHKQWKARETRGKICHNVADYTNGWAEGTKKATANLSPSRMLAQDN